MPKKSEVKILERDIKAAVLQAVNLSKRIVAWPQPTGVGRTMDGKRVIRYGVPGQADITGIVMIDDATATFDPNARVIGVRLEIEVKSATGRQSDEQKAFQAMIDRHGSVYLLVRSAQDAVAQLKARGLW